MAMPDHYPFRSARAQAEYLAWYYRRARTWPVPEEAHTVETAHGITWVRISGPPAAPPLVLLPGLGSNSFSWLSFIEAWSVRYRTYALDNIYDYGRSVAARPIVRADLTGWLNAVLEALRLESGIDMVGISLGAWLSSQYALRYPRRLRKMVWLAPVGTLLPMSWGTLLRALLSNLYPPVFLKPFLRYISPDLQRDAAGRAITDQVIDDIYLARRCFRPMPVIEPTVLTDAELGQLSVPTLCLIGEHERFHSAAKAMARLQRAAPQVCAEMVPGAGHDLTAVQAEKVSRRVLDFLSQP